MIFHFMLVLLEITFGVSTIASEKLNDSDSYLNDKTTIKTPKITS